MSREQYYGFPRSKRDRFRRNGKTKTRIQPHAPAGFYENPKRSEPDHRRDVRRFRTIRFRSTSTRTVLGRTALAAV